ncbi:MAG: type I secretion protein TolC [Halomonas sp.]|nr:TolC family outer membrane protein [Halomonas sp.]TVP51351.1 MAG: type I secretion protein TolC [Halomonas sp.]
MRLAHWAVNAPLRPLLVAVFTASFVLPVHAADLITITRDALDNNATLASARSEYLGIEAGRDVARGGLLPQISATGNVVHNQQYESQTASRVDTGTGETGADGSVGGGIGSAGTSDDRFNTASLSLEATQALFDEVTRQQVAQAERQIDQQVYLLAATEQQLLIDVASAYFDILRAHEVLEARMAQERAIGRQLEQAREQFEVGLIAITEVEEARATFDQSRADRIAAESNLQVAFEALEQFTGQRYASIEALGEDMPVALPEPSSRDYWVEQAIERNPQVLAQQAGIAISRSGVDIARAGRMPTLRAFGNYQLAGSDIDGTSGRDSSSQVGLSASLPIYTGGSTSASIRQGTYQLESSQYDFESQRRTTIQQVRSLYTQVSNDVETVEARQQAIVSTRSALEATRAGYEVGTRNIVDVLNAEQNLYNAIASYAEARYDYVVNLLSLRQQSGRLDVQAMEDVNGWLTGDSVNFTLPESGNNDRHQRALDIGAPPQPGS